MANEPPIDMLSDLADVDLTGAAAGDVLTLGGGNVWNPAAPLAADPRLASGTTAGQIPRWSGTVWTPATGVSVSDLGLLTAGGGISCPGTGAQFSQRFGPDSSAAGLAGTAGGRQSAANGYASTAYGQLSVAGDNATAVGFGSSAGFGSVSIGFNCAAAAAEFVSGSSTTQSLSVHFGIGARHSAAGSKSYSTTYFATSGLGTNKGGEDNTLAGGRSTGSGRGGFAKLATSSPGASGDDLNALVDRVVADHLGVRVFVPAAAPADAELANSNMVAYLNEAGNELIFKVRYSTGAYKTSAPIALS